MDTRGGGFTLGELLAVLAVLAVLAGTGLPALADFVREARITAAANALLHAAHLAQTEAHKRRERIALCRSRAARQCDDEAGWHEGWIVFVNLDNDAPPRRDPGEPVLHAGGAFRGGRIAANRRAFVFRPWTLRAVNGTLVLCDARGRDAARAVIISYTGRPRISRRSASGRPLACPPQAP